MIYSQKAVLGTITEAEKRTVAKGVRDAGYMLCELFQALEVLRCCLDRPDDAALTAVVVTDLASRMRKDALDDKLVAWVQCDERDEEHPKDALDDKLVAWVQCDERDEEHPTVGTLEPGDVLDAASHVLTREAIATEGGS